MSKLYDEENELLKELDKLDSKYYQMIKLNLKTKELLSKDLLNKNIKKINCKIRNIQSKLDNIYGYNSDLYSKNSLNIIKTDYKYNVNMYNLYRSIKYQKSSKQRVKIVKSVIELYTKLYNANIFSSESRDDIKNNIILLKNDLKIEKNYITKNVINNSCKKIPKKVINISHDKKDIVIKEIEIDYSSYDLKESLEVFKININNCELSEKYIINSKILLNRLNNVDNKNEYFKYIYSILDSLKYKKLHITNKDDYLIIRECTYNFKKFMDTYNVKEEVVKEKHDYKYDLLIRLLYDKDNYNLICKLLDDYDDFINIKNENKSIVIKILTLYLDNYMKIIKEHKYNFNIDYLREVYNLFMSNKKLVLSDNDKDNIIKMLDSFIDEVGLLDINPNKKRHVIGDVRKLYIENYKQENLEKKVDYFEYENNINEMYYYDMKHGSLKSKEVNLIYEDTFILNNPYTCYSYVEEKGKKVLKVHTADLSNVVEAYTSLNNEVYNSLLNNNEIDDRILDYLKFKKGELSSALTYEITLNDDLKIKGFKIYKSKIKVDGEILDYNSNKEKYRNLRRLELEYVRKYGDFMYKGLSRFEYVLNNMVQKEYVKYTRNNNLPLIAHKVYEVKALPTSTLSDFKLIFNKLDKKECKNLNNIFTSTIEDEFYDEKVRLNEEYDLSIIGHLDYLYLLNQRMIKDLVLDHGVVNPFGYNNIKQNTINEYRNLVELLNNILKHKGEECFDYKLRRRFKRYTLKKDEEEIEEDFDE